MTSQMTEEAVGVCMTMSRDMEYFWSMCLTKSTSEIVIEFLKKMSKGKSLGKVSKNRFVG